MQMETIHMSLVHRREVRADRRSGGRIPPERLVPSACGDVEPCSSATLIEDPERKCAVGTRKFRPATIWVLPLYERPLFTASVSLCTQSSGTDQGAGGRAAPVDGWYVPPPPVGIASGAARAARTRRCLPDRAIWVHRLRRTRARSCCAILSLPPPSSSRRC